MDMPKTYDATAHEGEVYRRWEDAGCFRAGAGARDGAERYVIAIPPPNVTGRLHIGHALNNTLQDCLIRWRRMQGRDVLWQPGTDHAGIATQSVVARHLDERGGPSREELGREAFVAEVWKWKEEYGGAIENQLRKLGSSCDWSRDRFTMDEGLSRAVREHFVRLYDAGLIYRGTRMVNWSPKLRTALANDEVEMHEVDGKMWRLRYPLADGDGHVDVETTRPETFFGDTAVAVHPDDPRHRDLIGKEVVLPVIGRRIPIVGDDHADPEKGTGAVKITPAHDPNDYEVGRRHDLPLVTVMDETATMTAEAGNYAGMDRFECRTALLRDLPELGALVGERAIRHAVGHCYRSHVPVEPRVTEQWFVSMRPLAERALAATREGRVNFHPERWTRVYCRWLEEVQDWCISRQIWWGHRIPAWYCADCDHVTVSREDPAECAGCGSEELRRDEDVLDTWFSSALWPFSTLGWPDADDPALARYFPTSTLVTDRGIIYFWVARMVMMSLFELDERPFDDVYIHGTVLDHRGVKMSKSLGNGIDPLVMIDGGTQPYLGEEYECPGYGADAVRYTLLDMTTEGQDLKLSPERFEGGRNFANKVYNAGRFLLTNLAGRDLERIPTVDDVLARDLGFEERWLLDRLDAAIAACTDALERWRFAEYVGEAYRFFRDRLCDWYLEWAKHQLRVGGDAAGTATAVLAYAFDRVLRLLHPGMPFLTEYLWQQLRAITGGAAWDGGFLMLQGWPEPDPRLPTPGAAGRMDELQDLVAGIRQLRNELGLADRVRLAATVERPADPARAAAFDASLAFLRDRANADVTVAAIDESTPGITRPVGDLAVRLAFDGEIREQLGGFAKKLAKQLAGKEKAAAGKRARLDNPKYVDNAPPDKVQETRDLLAADEAEIAKLRETLATLG